MCNIDMVLVKAADPIKNIEELRIATEAHLDKAQKALFDDSISDEDALYELDEAMRCLNTMIGIDAYN